MTTWKLLVVVPAMFLASLASASDDDVATLYRLSPVQTYGGESARIHIATFDAEVRSGGLGGTAFDYNWANCVIAAELFQAQPFVEVRYWCERGRVR